MGKKKVGALEVFEGRAIVVPHEGDAKAQVQSFSIDDGLSVTKYAQSGDEKKYPVYGAKDVSGTMEMLAGDLAGLAAMLGYVGSLDGIEVHLKADQTEFYLTKEFYNASDAVVFTEVLSEVTIEKIATSHGAEDSDKVTLTINAKVHFFVEGEYTPGY